MNTKFIVVGYYTIDTPYEDHACIFAKSMDRLEIPYYLHRINSLGNWHKNTGYKPTFIRRMLDKFPDCNIVYNDVDAEFVEYPVLFEELDCNIAVHNFDRRQFRQIKQESYEILSGTIFLKNCQEVKDLVVKWEAECKRRPMVWDQKSLAKVLQGEFYDLPPEYCKIFDIMRRVKEPVIVHYQASRELRKNKSLLPRVEKKNLRVVSSALSKEVL